MAVVTPRDALAAALDRDLGPFLEPVHIDDDDDIVAAARINRARLTDAILSELADRGLALAPVDPAGTARAAIIDVLQGQSIVNVLDGRDQALADLLLHRLAGTGHTVAPAQAAADGVALHDLIAAMPAEPGWRLYFHHDPDRVSVGRWDVRMVRDQDAGDDHGRRAIGHGATLEEAARATLEYRS